MSSRIAVCGQAPVSTARIRAGSSTPAERRNPGVLVGVDVVGDHAELELGGQLAAQQRDQRATCRYRPARRRRAAALVGWEFSGTEQPPGGVGVGLGPRSICGAPVAGMSAGSVEVGDLGGEPRRLAAAAATHPAVARPGPAGAA